MFTLLRQLPYQHPQSFGRDWPDGSGSCYNYFKVWHLHENHQQRVNTGQGWGESLAYSPEGNIVAAGNANGTIRIYNGFTMKHLKGFKAHNQRGIVRLGVP